MAQNVTPDADPPGWTAEHHLIEWLEELALQAADVRKSIAAINEDTTFNRHVDRILNALDHILALHLPEPRDGIAADLELLERLTDGLQVPRQGPAIFLPAPAGRKPGYPPAACSGAVGGATTTGTTTAAAEATVATRSHLREFQASAKLRANSVQLRVPLIETIRRFRRGKTTLCPIASVETSSSQQATPEERMDKGEWLLVQPTPQIP